MDATGSFARSESTGVDDYADSAIEAPALVGTDERRMHVRAYNYWVSLLSGRAYPSIEDLEPDNIDDFGPHSVLLDFTSGIENPTIAFLGNALRRECDLPVGVASVADIPRSSLLSRLTDHYLQIIANRAPIGFEAEFVNDRGNNTMYRGILMPFSSDDDTIDFIYGVINWKEVAEASESAAIIDEVERALAAAPKRHAPTAPIWADGPSARDLDAAGDQAPARHGFASAETAAPAEPSFAPTGDEGLGDWLAAARDLAEAAGHSESRSRHALYEALSLAYDFALVAQARPDEYADLLADAGITVQTRAPMTPIAKLVFGSGYDKTRLAEYSLVLGYAQRIGLGSGELLGAIESHAGGLKGIVQSERSERRPVAAAASPERDYRAKARAIAPKMIVPHSGDEEFILILARRVDAGHVAVIGSPRADDAMLQKALRTLQS